MSEEATFTLVFKEYSVLRTKQLYNPLTAKSFPNEQPYVVAPVPALVWNLEVAEKVEVATNTATEVIKMFCLTSFVLMNLLVIAKQQLWGILRTL